MGAGAGKDEDEQAQGEMKKFVEEEHRGDEGGAAAAAAAGERPAVTCTSIKDGTTPVGEHTCDQRRITHKPVSIDLSQITNSQNPFWKEHRVAGAGGGRKLYRVPDAADMEGGDKKLLQCGARTVVVFKLDDGSWAAMDNACYHHGGPLFLGDIEEVEGKQCVVCPWHRSKIALGTGEALYDALLDVDALKCETTQKQGGPRQRVHEVVVRGEDAFVRLNEEPEETYCSDRYAVLDIASNDPRRMDPDTADQENSSKEAMKEHIRRRRNSIKMQREQKKREPVRVPAGQLTPRADASRGPYVPSWVRKGELPPEPAVEEQHSWVPAHDLAEEFADLEAEYARRRGEADSAAAAADPRLADLGLLDDGDS
eukprot:Hpha_TRINITY_DN13645_c0_g2::TRINITY_DN13645_c0_g2_i1::g.122442::m.122442